jgi:hypothetical protein
MADPPSGLTKVVNITTRTSHYERFTMRAVRVVHLNKMTDPPPPGPRLNQAADWAAARFEGYGFVVRRRRALISLLFS